MSETIATVFGQQLFEQNSKQYYDRLFRRVFQLTGNTEEAEDITQASFVRFLRLMKRKQWQLEITYVQAYLARIATNLINDRWTEKGKEQLVSYDDDKTREAVELETAQTDESVVTIENRIYFKELYRALPKAVLAGLNEYERQILLLRRVDKLSIKEVAEIVGKDVCRVRYDLQKIEARLRYRVRKMIGAGQSAWDED